MKANSFKSMQVKSVARKSKYGSYPVKLFKRNKKCKFFYFFFKCFILLDKRFNSLRICFGWPLLNGKVIFIKWKSTFELDEQWNIMLILTKNSIKGLKADCYKYDKMIHFNFPKFNKKK